MSSTTLRTFSPTALAEAAEHMGYDAVEIWSELLWESGEDMAALENSIRDKNLLLSIHGPSRDINVTSLNRGIRRESREQYMKSLEDAARMGAELVNLHPGAFSGSHDKAETFIPEMTDYAGELAEAAGRLGVRVALEVMEVRTGEFMTDIPTAADIARKVNNPVFGITVDLAHLLSSRVPIELNENEPQIFHIHISGSTKERVHVPLTEGIYDLGAPQLEISNFFGGICAIESYTSGREMASAEENLTEFRRLRAEPMR
ncbi:MAG: sugar phosphate isomerase/epimerase [Nitrospinaceae bacterium]|nr:sugar phosphate isomerase/epimerase [Nitrospinaceae bacterium]MBT4093760.1 sugar phosphate isomerase/epimerase [Nitrospinaceae bacterium]MBT5948315.1 sugar phosphate isomerase/epimerase [Nitrospinaceae bacterium]